jgi:hypothetical protein
MDDTLLKTAAEYALRVFEVHCVSNGHSLGCDYALSMLRNALGQRLSDEDKLNLERASIALNDQAAR